VGRRVPHEMTVTQARLEELSNKLFRKLWFYDLPYNTWAAASPSDGDDDFQDDDSSNSGNSAPPALLPSTMPSFRFRYRPRRRDPWPESRQFRQVPATSDRAASTLITSRLEALHRWSHAVRSCARCRPPETQRPSPSTYTPARYPIARSRCSPRAWWRKYPPKIWTLLGHLIEPSSRSILWTPSQVCKLT
jgi:hypothetical protein